MYAIAKRNNVAFPPNRDAWKIEVFNDDDPNPVWERLAYDRNLIPGNIGEQLCSELSIGGYNAALEDVVLEGDHYRINNIRRRD
ncbi:MULTISPECIES: hypothetical protein [unclassified Agromyces]|uniref:hypothetical protein n=1 Tax=unclassified Agromyces TaxID=2639701 RepID=UPI003014BBBB